MKKGIVTFSIITTFLVMAGCGPSNEANIQESRKGSAEAEATKVVQNTAPAVDYTAKLNELVSALQHNTYGEYQRKAIVDFVATMNPKPAIPEEAQRHMARGKAAFNGASNESGFKNAVDEFQKAANIAPWWPSPYFNLGLVLEKTKDFPRAKANLEYYLMAAPEAPDAATVKEKIYGLEYLEEQVGKVDDYIDQAAALHNSDDYSGSISLLKSAIAIDPDSALAHHNLGKSYQQQKRFHDALPEFKEAIRLGKNSLEAYWNLAITYEDVGDEIRSLETYEEALSEHPWSDMWRTNESTRASLRFNMGELYYRQGNYTKAGKNWRLAIERGHPRSQEIQGWINEHT